MAIGDRAVQTNANCERKRPQGRKDVSCSQVSINERVEAGAARISSKPRANPKVASACKKFAGSGSDWSKARWMSTMTEDADDNGSRAGQQKAQRSLKQSLQQRQNPWFTTPAPIKRLFDRFPLETYPPNELPQRRPKLDAKHVLYVFATDEGARAGRPSFNPGCLKWQAYLTFKGLDLTLVPSNNHASPTGALPFLSVFPETLDPLASPNIVPPTKLQRWLQTSTGVVREEPSSMRYDAYMTLLDHRIRNAWLYTLYLEPKNFEFVAKRLYIDPSSNNPFVRFTLAYQLRQAAMTELLKHAAVVDVEALFREAKSAFKALSELLGDAEYFFSQKEPGLFDAAVFAYTHLLLDEDLEWSNTRLKEGLAEYANLVEHRERLLKRYF